MKKYNFTKGRAGEKMARDYLEKHGYIYIESNYSNDIGEIDLIMSNGHWLVFVEVKYKSDDSLGIPEEMINKNKLSQVKRVAEMYLVIKREMRKSFVKYRIDAVCILGNKIKHYENI